MSDERSSVIYLVGQGTYFRPRLLEVQYYRIVRHLQLVSEDEQKRFHVKSKYIGIHARHASSDFPCYSELPQLVVLCEAIKRGEYRTVFIDLDLHGGMEAIERALKEAGADVVNVSLDSTAVREAYSRRVLPGGDRLPYDASDFIAFFPHLTADIVKLLMKKFGRPDHNTIEDRLELLRGDRPIRGQGYANRLSPPWWEK